MFGEMFDRGTTCLAREQYATMWVIGLSNLSAVGYRRSHLFLV